MRNLEGKYCIVTGAGKGIGKAIAERFVAEQAAGVAIFEYNYELAQATALELDPTGKKVIAIKCNVANIDDVKAAIDQTLATFGRIDVLVNNAGITRDAIFHKMTPEEWHAVIDVNLNGVFNTCHYVVPLMREQESGAIVNISSTSLKGNPGQANYAATKAALQGFTRTMGKELGRKNVRMNCVAPAHVDTDMMRSVPAEQFASLPKRNPMQRLAQPEEIASVVTFLCTEDASWINAQTIYASGGAATD